MSTIYAQHYQLCHITNMINLRLIVETNKKYGKCLSRLKLSARASMGWLPYDHREFKNHVSVGSVVSNRKPTENSVQFFNEPTATLCGMARDCEISTFALSYISKELICFKLFLILYLKVFKF